MSLYLFSFHVQGVDAPISDLNTLSDENFIMKPRKEIHCSKCKGIPLAPKRPRCNCNVVYCEACAKAVPVCPLCGKNEGFNVDLAMRRRIWNLQVPCTYKSRGCDWRGVLCKLADHEKVCPKRNIPCKYKALGCEKMLGPDDASAHDETHMDKHVQLALDMVVKLVDQVKMLENEVAKLKEN